MAAETDTNSGFDIEGRHYPIPDMGTFTMDEAQTLWDYSGLGLEDFSVPEDESDEEREARQHRYRNPGFLRALMHIAYQRGNPEVRPNRVKALIGNANVIAAFEGLLADEEDEPNPPAMTSAHGQSLPSGSDDLNGNSGPALEHDSDAPAETPENIGTTK